MAQTCVDYRALVNKSFVLAEIVESVGIFLVCFLFGYIIIIISNGLHLSVVFIFHLPGQS